MIIDVSFATQLHKTTMNITNVDILVISIAIMVISCYLIIVYYFVMRVGHSHQYIPMYSVDHRRQFTHDYLLDEN